MEVISSNLPLLTTLILFPIFSSFLLLFVREELVKFLSILASLIEVLFSLSLLYRFDLSNSEKVQFFERYYLLKDLNLSFAFGVDGLSLLMVLLNALITLVAVLWSIRDRQITFRLKEYYAWLLFSCGVLMGVFISFDLISFYVFYELTLVPMFFLIGIWGYKLRLYSAYKFFIYIFASSLLLLIGIGGVAVVHKREFGHFSFFYLDLLKNHYGEGLGLFLFLLFFIAFWVKSPFIPFHTWLPDAHGEAPTAGSVFLAAVLLKMGTYAILRFNFGLFPQITLKLQPFLIFLGILTIIYASWMTLVQKNVKRFVAYSSVSHMGFILTALSTLNLEGFRGGVMEMFAHGLTSAGLFMVAGFIYNRLHTFNFDRLRGSIRFMPLYALTTLLIVYGAMGLPGGSSFWGKFLTILSTNELSFKLSLITLIGAFFSAMYLLYFIKTLYIDAQTESVIVHFSDLRGYKLIAFTLLVIFIIFVGLYPKPFFKIYEASLKLILGGFK